MRFREWLISENVLALDSFWRKVYQNGLAAFPPQSVARAIDQTIETLGRFNDFTGNPVVMQFAMQVQEVIPLLERDPYLSRIKSSELMMLKAIFHDFKTPAAA